METMLKGAAPQAAPADLIKDSDQTKFAKDDPAAQVLYAAARTYPTRYLRIEWLDRREGPLAAADIDYPELPQAAAFACANGACSLPVLTPTEIAGIVGRVDDR